MPLTSISFGGQVWCFKKVVGKKDMGFVVEFYPLLIVWPLGQRISRISFTRSMCKFEMVFLKELFPLVTCTKSVGCKTMYISGVLQDI